jgi:hypothetical protein
VEDERLLFCYRCEVGQLAVVLFDVDEGQAVVAEDAKLLAESQVDAGGLQIAVLPGVDDQPAGLDLFADAVVAEDGRERAPVGF